MIHRVSLIFCEKAISFFRGFKSLTQIRRKKSFYTHRTTYANKKDIRPEKPDFIGLFHVSGGCKKKKKNVDVKRLFYRFSGK